MKHFDSGPSSESFHIFRTSVGTPLDTGMLDAIVDLRFRAWHSRGVMISRAIDEFDRNAIHLVAKIGVRFIASARLTIHYPDEFLPDGLTAQDVPDATRIGVLTRLAVDPLARGRGLGERFDRMRIEQALAAGCSHMLACTSAISRPAALLSNGFARVRATRSEFTGLPAEILMRRL